MQVTIVKADNFVSVDGVQKQLDLSFLPADFHALQYDSGSGVVESSDIDNCLELKNITDWPLWSEFDAKAKAAKNAPTAADFDEIIPEMDMSVSADPEPPPLEETKQEPPTEEELMSYVRIEREHRLRRTDIDLLKLFEAGEPVPEALKSYREALRELPNQITEGKIAKPTWDADKEEVVFNSWPTAP